MVKHVCATLFVPALAAGAAFPCASPSFVDSFTSLPTIPLFPTKIIQSTLAADAEITEDHWSERAILLRPPRQEADTLNVQRNCPHMQAGLENWHDPAVWGGQVPEAGEVITLPENKKILVSSCSVDPSIHFGTINIPATSELIFADAAIEFHARGIVVSGGFKAGSQSCRLRNRVRVVLHGARPSNAGTVEEAFKAIIVYGSIDVHGVEYTPTWTRLAATASPGDEVLYVQDKVNWQAGQAIVVTTTELKDSRDWHGNEELTIQDVALAPGLGPDVAAIRVSRPLQHTHYGGREYQAEVMLLSRTVSVEGFEKDSEPTDTEDAICTDTDASGAPGSTFPCDNRFLTGFGAHIRIVGGASAGRFSGLEMTRAGQTNVLGAYPIHFHLMSTYPALVPANTAVVTDCSVHKSYFRAYAVHGTSGASLVGNVAYDVIGHAYFLEDGVEEENEIKFNIGALVHTIGPGLQESFNYPQETPWVSESPSLILPSDISASVFYIPNLYNTVEGNAASGGWAGFGIPSLTHPVKDHTYIKDMSPKARPTLSFKGNSAHSTGFWWHSAAGIYAGGELKHEDDGAGAGGKGTLTYTHGRSATKDTCSDKTKINSCWDAPIMRWNVFSNNKVFLSNRGLQSWGDRSEVLRFEDHDVGMSMNVFGMVWVDQMLHNCRSRHAPNVQWMQGCPSAGTRRNNPPWGICSKRDWTFHSSFDGFQWYDVGQRHIVTNSVFRNCDTRRDDCIYGPSPGLCNGAIWSLLTHSDQFVPELMQATSNIHYQNENPQAIWRFAAFADRSFITTSGRLQSWFDADGSASVKTDNPDCGRVYIGSDWSGEWHRIVGAACEKKQQMWACSMSPSDSSASLIVRHGLGGDGQVASSLELSLNGKITGPIVHSQGGWFLRFTDKGIGVGTPKQLFFRSIQVRSTDQLYLAIPYPPDTSIVVVGTAARWCSESWATCTHTYTEVLDLAGVHAGPGDRYFFDRVRGLLFVQAITWPLGYYEGVDNDVPWTTQMETTSFSRGGLDIPDVTAEGVGFEIRATKCGGTLTQCDPYSAEIPFATPFPKPHVYASDGCKPPPAANVLPNPTPPSPTSAPTAASAAPTTQTPTATPSTAAPANDGDTNNPTALPTAAPSSAPTPSEQPPSDPTTAKPTAAPKTATATEGGEEGWFEEPVFILEGFVVTSWMLGALGLFLILCLLTIFCCCKRRKKKQKKRLNRKRLSNRIERMEMTQFGDY